MRTSILVLGIFVAIGLALEPAHSQPPPTRVRAFAYLRNDASCQSLLASSIPAIEDNLAVKGVQSASAYLGVVSELADLLKAAGTPPNRARQMAAALEQLHDLASKYPSLNFLVESFLNATANTRVLACLLSVNCKVPPGLTPSLVFNKPNNDVIIVFPHYKGTPQYFAVNFFGAFGGAAGEDFLVQWLEAGYQLEHVQGVNADAFYQKYASAYKGGLPRPDDLNQAFTGVFMSLYQLHVTTQLALLAVKTEISAGTLAQNQFAELKRLQPSKEAAEIFAHLGLNEQTILERTVEMIDSMTSTILRARPASPTTH